MVFWGGKFTTVKPRYYTIVNHTIVYHGKFTAPKYHGIFFYGIPWYFLTRDRAAYNRGRI